MPVIVLIAPVIPGLNDSEIPAILQAAKEAGAHAAGFQMLRLPLTVAPVFQDWLQREQPNSLQRIEGRIRGTRDGKLNHSEFGTRMRGTGPIAEQIRGCFVSSPAGTDWTADCRSMIAASFARRGRRRDRGGCSERVRKNG